MLFRVPKAIWDQRRRWLVDRIKYPDKGWCIVYLRREKCSRCPARQSGVGDFR
jgi:hypothetical protein